MFYGHGHAASCLEQLKVVESRCSRLLLTRLVELIAYLQRNSFRLVHHAEQYRQGLPISTSAAESSVESVISDRFRNNRKMRWPNEGANALLHIRVADLNGELASALKRRHWSRPKQSDDNNPWRYWWMSWPAWAASRSWTT